MDERAALIISVLSESDPELIAAYLFGSRARGDATATSDHDVAILRTAPMDSLQRWKLQERLASLLGCSVDLVDLRAASTVMRVKVLESARVLIDRAPGLRAGFEATALSAYARLNEERRGILEDVRRRGTVHG